MIENEDISKGRVLEDEEEDDDEQRDSVIRKPIWAVSNIPKVSMSQMNTYFMKYRGLNPIIESDSLDFGYTVE